MKISLTWKVNSLIFSVLALGIGFIAYFLSGRLVENIDENINQGLDVQSRTIYSAVEALMLPGQAELAEGYFSRLRTLDRSQEVHIYRTDGTEAFVDNSTIRWVNRRFEAPRFPERTNPGSPFVLSVDDFFKAAITPPAVSQVFETSGPDGQFITIFRPLLNLPRCTVCHGADHTFRGVLEIRRDITASRTMQTTALGASSIAFLGVLAISALILSYFLSRSVLMPVRKIGEVCDLVAQGNLGAKVDLLSRDELGNLAARVNGMITGLQEKLKLSKYVSGTTLRSVQQEESNERSRKTLIFTDIRGFTAYSETRDPEEVVHMLNHLLGFQTSILHQHGGDVDKYVGDEIFAVFPGGPEGVLACCSAALEIQKGLKEEKNSVSGLQVGIGIHEGEVILGRIGSDLRADYTAIGDSVNLAARLCALAEPGRVLISETVAGQLKQAAGKESGMTGWKLAGPQVLSIKGKTGTHRVWSLRKEGV